MTPWRAFLISFAAGLIALVGGQAVLSSLLATPPEAPLKGPLNVPTA
jgi:hypothetical protein